VGGLTVDGPRFNPVSSLFAAPVRAIFEVRLLLVLLAVNLTVGLVFSVPFLFPALQTFGHTLSFRDASFPSFGAWMAIGSTLEKGGGGFVAGSTLLAMVLAFILQLLLAGGVTARMSTEGRFVFFEFGALCSRLWGRNLRLYVWSLLALIPMLAVCVGSGVLLHAFHKPTLFTQKPESWFVGSPFGAWSVGHLAFCLWVWSGWRASLDVARAEIFNDDLGKTRVAMWRAFKRVMSSPFAWLGYALLGALAAAAVLAAIHFHGLMRVDSTGRALLALLAAQGVVLVRLVGQLATVAYAVDLSRTMPVPKVEAPPPPPPPAPVEEEEKPAGEEPAFVADLGSPKPQ
jgi:hypothetical protein